MCFIVFDLLIVVSDVLCVVFTAFFIASDSFFLFSDLSTQLLCLPITIVHLASITIVRLHPVERETMLSIDWPSGKCAELPNQREEFKSILIPGYFLKQLYVGSHLANSSSMRTLAYIVSWKIIKRRRWLAIRPHMPRSRKPKSITLHRHGRFFG